MIQPIDINDDDEGEDKSYRVHDIVVDLVCFLPSKENFVMTMHYTEWKWSNPKEQEAKIIHTKEHGRYDSNSSSMSQEWSLAVSILPI